MTLPLSVVDPHLHLRDRSTGLYPQFERPSKGRTGSNAAIARSYHLEEFLEANRRLTPLWGQKPTFEAVKVSCLCAMI